jgi:hypothetical protein
MAASNAFSNMLDLEHFQVKRTSARVKEVL